MKNFVTLIVRNQNRRVGTKTLSRKIQYKINVILC